MEIRTIQIGMFEMMGIVVLVIYFGQWIREKLPVLKKYCIPSAVVGGTIFSILTCILYMTGIVQFEWENQSVMNNFFYNIFFAGHHLLRPGSSSCSPAERAGSGRRHGNGHEPADRSDGRLHTAYRRTRQCRFLRSDRC